MKQFIALFATLSTFCSLLGEEISIYKSALNIRNILAITAIWTSIIFTATCSNKGSQDAILEETQVQSSIKKEIPEVDIVFATGEWAPYTSENMKAYGVFTEIVTTACEEAGLTYHILFYPWKRGEEAVARGEVFATFPYMKTAERQERFNYSKSVMRNSMCMFYMKYRDPKITDIKWKTFKDFKPFKIGGVLGYWYEIQFKEAGLTVEYVSDDNINIRKLYHGRIDYAASEELVGWQSISTNFPEQKDQFAAVSKPLQVGNLYVMVSRTYPDSDKFLVRFNEGLKKIRANGKYQEIILRSKISR